MWMLESLGKDFKINTKNVIKGLVENRNMNRSSE